MVSPGTAGDRETARFVPVINYDSLHDMFSDGASGRRGVNVWGKSIVGCLRGRRVTFSYVTPTRRMR
ncbi:MAG: hypothetical protein ACREH8_14580 [Opitutaceae bacterium]